MAAVLSQQLRYKLPAIRDAAIALEATGLGPVEFETIDGRPAVWLKNDAAEYALIEYWHEERWGGKVQGGFDIMDERGAVIAENLNLRDAVQLIVWRIILEEMSEEDEMVAEHEGAGHIV
jgi:hypothetical protein